MRLGIIFSSFNLLHADHIMMLKEVKKQYKLIEHHFSSSEIKTCLKK